MALVENLTDVVRWFVGVQHHTAACVIGKYREGGLAEEIRGLFLAPRGPVKLRRLAQPFESTRIHGVKGDIGLVERPRQPFSRRIDVCGTFSRWIRRSKGQVAPHEQDRLVAHQRTRELLGQRRERLRHADAAQAFAGKLLRGQLDAIQRLVRPRAPRGNGVGQGGRERWFLERAGESLGDGSVESCAVGCDSLRVLEQPGSREHHSAKIRRAEAIDRGGGHGARRLHRLAARRRTVHNDDDKAALRRQLVGLDIWRNEWRRRGRSGGAARQRHRRERRQRARFAVDEHLEVRCREARDRMTVLVEHRDGELHDVDATAKAREVLLRRNGYRRSHKDESDDAAHLVRIISFPKTPFKRAQSFTQRTESARSFSPSWCRLNESHLCRSCRTRRGRDRSRWPTSRNPWASTGEHA